MIVNNVVNSNQVTNKTSNINTTKAAKEATFDTYLADATEETKELSLNEIFDKAAETYNVPVNLLKAIGYAESSFRVDATSHCGAQGIMQLMPATADYLGVTDAYDPEQNIMGGAKYIASLIKKYDGNTSLALAAYNAGSGNVAKYGGIPPFKETQNYVVKVTNYMKQNLDANQKVVVGGNSQTGNSTYVPVFEDVDEELVRTIDDTWNEIFSYDQYELFLKILGEEEENQKQEKESVKDSSLSQISMNPSVANLLRSANITSLA